ncbi:MAG: 50S ribosomal protein L21 [Phycisphaerales bacterium]|nr:50S ribosomal protein L21 [Phycisphaerales bacterium]
MYAIIEESGGQRKVEQGEDILVDLLEQGQAQKGARLTFDKVLVIGETGGSARIGTPYVGGASVTAEVVEPVVKGDKVYIHKFRSKKGYNRKTGHRQRFTHVRITGING